jgi:hypothetical protein
MSKNKPKTDLADKHDLVDLLRDLARKGQLNHLSIGHSFRDGKNKFQAGFRDQTSPGYCIAIEEDPVEALLMVLLNKGYRHYPGNKDAAKLPERQEVIRSKDKRDLLG